MATHFSHRRFLPADLARTTRSALISFSVRLAVVFVVTLAWPCLAGCAAGDQPLVITTEVPPAPASPAPPYRWEEVWRRSVLRGAPVAFDFADARKGLTVGKGVWATSDGGDTWARRSAASPDLSQMNAISMVDGLHAYAVGAGGRIMATSDGGSHWRMQASGTRAYLADVDFVDRWHGWAVGSLDHHPVVVTTRDGGATWTARRLPGSGGLNAVDFVDERRGWVVGLNDEIGEILATTDGGRTWSSQRRQGEEELYDVAAADAQHACAVGSTGALFVTKNGWSWPNQNWRWDYEFYAVFFLDAKHGWVTARNHDECQPAALIMSTVDGGLSWSLDYSYPGYDVRIVAVHFLGSDRGWALGVRDLPSGSTTPILFRAVPRQGN